MKDYSFQLWVIAFGIAVMDGALLAVCAVLGRIAGIMTGPPS